MPNIEQKRYAYIGDCLEDRKPVLMMPAELKLITERTHHLIDAANHTLEYSKIVIEQSKKLILGINEKRLQRERRRKNK